MDSRKRARDLSDTESDDPKEPPPLQLDSPPRDEHQGLDTVEYSDGDETESAELAVEILEAIPVTSTIGTRQQDEPTEASEGGDTKEDATLGSFPPEGHGDDASSKGGRRKKRVKGLPPARTMPSRHAASEANRKSQEQAASFLKGASKMRHLADQADSSKRRRQGEDGDGDASLEQDPDRSDCVSVKSEHSVPGPMAGRNKAGPKLAARAFAPPVRTDADTVIRSRAAERAQAREQQQKEWMESRKREAEGSEDDKVEEESSSSKVEKKSRWKCFGEGPPRKVDYVMDEKHKSARLEDVIRIPPPADAKGPHFEWTQNKYFTMAVFNGNNERLRASQYGGPDAEVVYSIVQEDAKGGPEDIFEAAGKPNTTGLYYFKLPKFLIPGTYTIGFKLRGSDKAKRLRSVTHTVRVELIGARAQSPPAVKPSAAPEKQSKHHPPPPPPADHQEKQHQEKEKAERNIKLRSAASTPTASVGTAAAPTWETEGEEESSKPEVQLEDEVQSGPLLSLRISSALRKTLLEDWFAVTRKRMLVALPRKPCVAEIVRDYEREFSGVSRRGSSGKGRGGGPLLSLADRLCTLFDGALGNLLLYRFEREQYVRTLESNPKSSAQHLYGAEHLLRLLVSCPRLFTPESSDPAYSSAASLTTSSIGAAAAAAGAASSSGAAAAVAGGSRSDEAAKGKERAAHIGGTKPPASAFGSEVDHTREFLQGLLDHLDSQQFLLFAEHQQAPEGYGADVPRTARQSM